MTRPDRLLGDHTASNGAMLPRLSHITVTFFLILMFFGPFFA